MCQRLPVRSADRDSLAASPLIRTPTLSWITRTRSSAASIMLRVRKRRGWDAWGESRGGWKGQREITRQEQVLRQASTFSDDSRREVATWYHDSRYDALARTHARPLHAIRLRGRSQPSNVNPTTGKREGHATLHSLPSDGGPRRRPTPVAFRAQPRVSVFEVSSHVVIPHIAHTVANARPHPHPRTSHRVSFLIVTCVHSIRVLVLDGQSMLG